MKNMCANKLFKIGIIYYFLYVMFLFWELGAFVSNSNRGYNLLSKTWSREEREKQNRNKGREVERADEALRGNKDNIEGKFEESANEINDSTFTMTKRKYARGQQNVGSPTKATRSHTTRGEEERRGGVEGDKNLCY
jgi:hypothetical protein